MAIEAFHYPAAPDAPPPLWEAWGDALPHAASDTGPAAAAARPADIDHTSSEKPADEALSSFEAGRERGRQEGRQAEREAQTASQTASQAEAEKLRRVQAAALVESFAQARDRYLHTVEHEVVKLALAIAARILRREAQMDPLLLAGAVRVALGQLSASTEVRLFVPGGEIDLWTEALALVPNLALRLQVLPGEGMRLGDCLIETEMGSVDLGVRAQLSEIERGFFDRAGSAAAPSVEEAMA